MCKARRRALHDSTHQAEIAPIGNRDDQRDDVRNRVDRIDPAHERVGEAFAVGGGVGEHMPIDLVGEKPNFRGDQNHHGDDPWTHADVDR